MSRQIQLRRGTADDHETFTGAIGEVTVDTTNNTLRVHDGETVGGTALARADAVTDMSGADYVIAWQMPTSENNYKWYRKYHSGWVEQGGVLSSQVALPITMLNAAYIITLGNSSGDYEQLKFFAQSKTGFKASTGVGIAKGYWMVCGIAE